MAKMRVRRNTNDFCVNISEFLYSVTECNDLRWANKRTEKRKIRGDLIPNYSVTKELGYIGKARIYRSSLVYFKCPFVTFVMTV